MWLDIIAILYSLLTVWTKGHFHSLNKHLESVGQTLLGVLLAYCCSRSGTHASFTWWDSVAMMNFLVPHGAVPELGRVAKSYLTVLLF